jgi:FkbM family methyltransferase
MQSLRRAILRHEHRPFVRALVGARLGLQVAPRIATGPSMARVVLAGLLLGGGRRRPFKLRLTAPNGPVPFLVPDYEALIVFREVFVAGEYAMAGVSPPATILDLGASVGVSALFFRRQYPDARIVAVEASPALSALLRRNVAALGVEVRPVAVAARSGTVPFYESSESWTGSTARAVGRPVQVPAESLDDLLAVGADMVKLDIEGAEFDVLPASRRLREARVVVGEIHAPPGSAEAAQLLATLEGFDVTISGGGDDYTIFRAVRARSRSPLPHRSDGRTARP